MRQVWNSWNDWGTKELPALLDADDVPSSPLHLDGEFLQEGVLSAYN